MDYEPPYPIACDYSPVRPLPLANYPSGDFHPGRRKLRLGPLVVLVLLFGGVAVWWSRPSLSKLPPPPAAAAPLPPAWWSGVWRAEGKDVPSLQLAGYGNSVSGELVLAFTAGYVLGRPLRAGQAQGDAVLFAVDAPPTKSAWPQPGMVPAASVTWFLLLRRDLGADLFKLKEAPFVASAPGAQLYPVDAAKAHTFLAHLNNQSQAPPIVLVPEAFGAADPVPVPVEKNK